MPLVSVIIPSYNHAQFLKERIDSIINQTFQDFEIIILDDYSTDNSREIIESYKNHPKVSQIIFNEENSHCLTKQWLKGFLLAKGDYIWIAESDDYCTLDFLQNIINEFDKHKNVGIVYSNSFFVDKSYFLDAEKLKNDRNQWFNNKKWSSDYIENGKIEIKENLLHQCTIINMSATVFKKDLLYHINWDQLFQFKYQGDWFFLINLVYYTDIAYIAKPLNYWRVIVDNFDKADKAHLQFSHEKALIRYFWYPRFESNFTTQELEMIKNNFGIEMQLQINDTITKKLSVLKLIRYLNGYKKSNPILWRLHYKAGIKRYINRYFTRSI